MWPTCSLVVTGSRKWPTVLKICLSITQLMISLSWSAQTTSGNDFPITPSPNSTTSLLRVLLTHGPLLMSIAVIFHRELISAREVSHEMPNISWRFACNLLCIIINHIWPRRVIALASARGPILPPPNHLPLKMFIFQAFLLPLNGKSKLRKKIFWIFWKFLKILTALLYLLSEIGNFNFVLDNLPDVLRTCRLVVRVALTPRAHVQNFIQIGVTVFTLQRVVF